MTSYRRNKLKTVADIVRRIENWPEALSLRMRQSRSGLSLLRFRDGLNLVLRGNTRDWDVVHELAFAGGYAMAFEWLRRRAKGRVLDFGGNIGLFSLLAARCAPELHVTAFEPGPPNHRLFEVNRLINPDVSDRITVHKKAVGGRMGAANWFFDEANPGASSLYATHGATLPVEMESLENVIAGIEDPIALVKIDVEGAEYEMLEATPAELWARIPAIALEVHVDPRGKSSKEAFISRMTELGFLVEQESVVSFFLTRNSGKP